MEWRKQEGYHLWRCLEFHSTDHYFSFQFFFIMIQLMKKETRILLILKDESLLFCIKKNLNITSCFFLIILLSCLDFQSYYFFFLYFNIFVFHQNDTCTHKFQTSQSKIIKKEEDYRSIKQFIFGRFFFKFWIMTLFLKLFSVFSYSKILCMFLVLVAYSKLYQVDRAVHVKESHVVARWINLSSSTSRTY